LTTELATEPFVDLPRGWTVRQLADIAELQSGGTPSKKRLDFWQGSIPWASPKDMKQPYLLDTEDHISQEGLADASRQVPAGSLFIVVRGMILDRDIPISMAMVPMAFNQDMKAIIPNGRVNGHFLLFALRQFREQLRRDVGSSAHGTKRIGTSALEQFRVPVPPPQEQQAIANVLRTVQRAKEAAEAVVAAARQLKRSLLRHLFTYGPVPVEQAERVALKETGIGWIPERWAVRELAAVADVKTGTSSCNAVRALQGSEPDGEVFFLKVSDMNLPGNHRHLNAAVTRLAVDSTTLGRLNTVPPGATVLPKRGAAIATNKKRLTVAPSLLDPNLMAIVPGTEVQSDYLFEWFEQFDLRTITDTTTLPQLNKKDVEPLQLPIPSLPEQRQIVTMLDRVNRKIEAEAGQLDALNTLFKTLLCDLMTGRVRVHDLKPTP
jgi:type I restriction enzyme S subunit